MDEELSSLTNRLTASETTVPSRPRRLPRWALGCVGAVVVLTAAVLGHRAILRACAAALIVEREEGCPDAIWLDSGDHRFQTAADLYHEDPRRVILVARSFPNRLVELGILPPREEVARSRLEERGVPASAVAFFGESCRDGWETARALGTWMQTHPNARILVVCERFRSRQLHMTLGQVLSPDEVARIDIRTLPNYLYDETNWWKVRPGLKGFVGAWLGWWCVWAFGEPPERPPVWTADEYEAEIARSIGRATR